MTTSTQSNNEERSLHDDSSQFDSEEIIDFVQEDAVYPKTNAYGDGMRRRRRGSKRSDPKGSKGKPPLQNLSGHSTDSVDFTDEDAAYPSARAFVTNKKLKRRNLERKSSEDTIDLMKKLDNDGIDFNEDPPIQMTRGRRLALKLLEKEWYNPRLAEEKEIIEKSRRGPHELDEEDAVMINSQLPSLKKAWSYFEHVTLVRYIVGEHNVNTDHMSFFQRFRHSFTNYTEELERAQPGEKMYPTKLYDPITTPHAQVRTF